MIGAMAREEGEDGRILESDIIKSSEEDSGRDQVIIKVLIDFLDLLLIFYLFSNEAYPKTKPQSTNRQELIKKTSSITVQIN